MRHCSLRRQGVKVVMVETVKPCVSAGVSVGVETSSHKHLQTAALQTSLCPKPTARGHNWETALQLVAAFRGARLHPGTFGCTC